MIESVWIIGLGLALASGLWLLLAARHEGDGAHERERRQLNADAYREQLAMLDARRAAGEIDPASYARDKAVLDQRILTELEPADAPWSSGRWGWPQQAGVLAVPVLIAAGMFAASDGAQHFGEGNGSAEGTPSVEQMVTGLAARLQENPDDLRGWAMLGRSYTVLGRQAEAAQAYRRANALSDNSNPELLVAEAEALALSRDQDFEGRPKRLIETALALDGDHIRGLWYALVAARQYGDAAAAEEYLARLSRQPDLPPQLEEILQAEFGVSRQPEPRAADGMHIDVVVALGEELRGQLPPNGTLFVFARALNGPPMPLAVYRRPLPTGAEGWPLAVQLDDGMAMMPELKLSSFEAWRLTARISRSGQAEAQSGDWEGELKLERAPQGPVRVTIDRQID